MAHTYGSESPATNALGETFRTRQARHEIKRPARLAHCQVHNGWNNRVFAAINQSHVAFTDPIQTIHGEDRMGHYQNDWRALRSPASPFIEASGETKMMRFNFEAAMIEDSGR